MGPLPVVTPENLGDFRCIFRIDATLDAVFVSGCISHDEDRPHAWWLTAAANVNRSCDAFNHWAEFPFAGGARADKLTYLRANGAAELTIGAPSLRVSTTNLGFYGAVAVPKAASYVRGARSGRTLSGSLTVVPVLNQLLEDLTALGLIDSEVTS